MKKPTQIAIVILMLAWVRVRAESIAPAPAAPPPAAPANNLPTGFQPIFNSIGTALTNWSWISGYGRSLTGKNNIAFTDFAFNFNTNVGVVLGYDHLWTTHTNANNFVKGGATLSAQLPSPGRLISPNFLPNVVTIPFVADLVATPKGNNAVGNIVTTGLDFRWSFCKPPPPPKQPEPPGYSFDIGVQYENRSGQGNWSGNYVLFHLGISRTF